MHIEINGYRNLENFSYKIQKNKLNYLFGVSGSGKSSIGMALLGENVEYNKKVDFKDNIGITINGKKTETDLVMIFDNNSVNRYISEDKDENVFNIIIDEDNDLLRAQEDFDKYMIRFKNVIDGYAEKFNELESLTKTLGGSLTTSNKFRSSAKILKLENDFKKNKSTKIVRDLNIIGSNKLDWIVRGVEFMPSNICPFCDKKMSKPKVIRVNAYAQYDIKNLNLVRKASQSNSVKEIKEPTYTTKGIEKLKEDILSASIAVKEFIRLKNLVNNIDDEINVGKLSNFDVEKDLFIFFPEMKKVVVSINNNIDNINKKTEMLNDKTKYVLRQRLAGLSKSIELLGIPYQIDIIYKKNKIKSYKLVHKDDSSKVDRSHSLSNGEKNIIAFLIYVLDVMKNGEDKICIIDDPISSYDEHRRKIIYDYIKEKLRSKTVLILSHDNVFARIAASDSRSKLNGGIHYFENYKNSIELIEITLMDFNKFDDFLVERVNQVDDYYQKIINVRMLYEGKGASPVYGYLSKILHFKNKTTIDEWLLKKSKSEEEILSQIKETHNIILPNYVSIDPKAIDTTNYSLIEKAGLVREFLPKTHINRNELNHIMHVEDRLNICLNPHKFNFCSEDTRKVIEAEISRIYM